MCAGSNRKLIKPARGQIENQKKPKNEIQRKTNTPQKKTNKTPKIRQIYQKMLYRLSKMH